MDEREYRLNWVSIKCHYKWESLDIDGWLTSIFTLLLNQNPIYSLIAFVDLDIQMGPLGYVIHILNWWIKTFCTIWHWVVAVMISSKCSAMLRLVLHSCHQLNSKNEKNYYYNCSLFVWVAHQNEWKILHIS